MVIDIMGVHDISYVNSQSNETGEVNTTIFVITSKRFSSTFTSSSMHHFVWLRGQWKVE